MSFNSKAFLADRERLLEPEQELQINYRSHYKSRYPFAQITEQELDRLSLFEMIMIREHGEDYPQKNKETCNKY